MEEGKRIKRRKNSIIENGREDEEMKSEERVKNKLVRMKGNKDSEMLKIEVDKLKEEKLGGRRWKEVIEKVFNGIIKNLMGEDNG